MSDLGPPSAPAPWLAFSPPAPKPRVWINVILFVLTCLSTVVAGAYLSHFDQDLWRFWAVIKYRPRMWLDGLPFAVTLMAILTAHELGHYFLSRHHRVNCSLPYFLPGPNLVGTFGAVIFMRSPIPNRKALFDIGAAGPLMGLLVATLALVIGLATARPEWMLPQFDTRGAVVFFPNLFFNLVSHLVPLAGPPPLPVETLIQLQPQLIYNSPFLDAAAVGFLVTMLNLMPIGQLDGGHVSAAVFGRRAVWVTGMALALMAALSFYWLPWLFLGLFLFLMTGVRGLIHPPPLDPISPLGPLRTVLAFVVLVIFLLILTPVPVDVLAPGI